jgi:hypothetical protein
MSSLNNIEISRKTLELIILATPFTLGLSGFLMTVQLARSGQFYILIHSLRNSHCLVTAIQTWGMSSLKSKISVVSMMSGVVLHPSYFVKRGLLNANDAKNLPAYLKLRMRIASWLLLLSVSWLLLLAIFHH